MKILRQAGITITSRVCEIHGKTTVPEMEDEIRAARDSGDSVGGIVEIVAKGCPAGIGDPVFGKLDAMIAGAMMGIGAVKGVEIGEGFGVAVLYGHENNDPITLDGFLSNHAGGILGGISTGADIVVKIAVKPTPSISRDQQTITTGGEPRNISIRGRHDPCIVPRIAPVAESMLALVVLDAFLEQAKYEGFSRRHP